jgi:RNA polymerase sigma-70 factor, ECF subfamily
MDPGFRARIRAGDEGAFGALFREHGRAVYNHCFRLTGDWSVAEDCTSLVFLEAWRLREKVEPQGGGLLPWLLGIATHVIHRRRRVARRHRALMQRMPVPGLLPDFADEVVGRLEDQDKIAAVRAALERLSRADREVLALCVWAGLDYAAAAESLGVPVGTVRSRLSRARRRLEKLAGNNFGPDREPAVADWQHAGGRTEAVPPSGGEPR